MKNGANQVIRHRESTGKEVTICIFLKGDPASHILLGLKKTGLGQGKYVGPGGKVESGETPEQAAIREVREEVEISLVGEDLEYVGQLTFIFAAKPEWNELAHVFLARQWVGDPVETGEIKPVWFSVGDIPYKEMWDDYHHWLPGVLEGQKITARFVYSPDNETVASMTADERIEPTSEMQLQFHWSVFRNKRTACSKEF